MLEFLFIKFVGLQAYNFIKKRLQHRCFPVKFDKFLRTPILKNICGRLFLLIVDYRCCKKNCKQRLIYSPPTKRGEQTPLKLQPDITTKFHLKMKFCSKAYFYEKLFLKTIGT